MRYIGIDGGMTMVGLTGKYMVYGLLIIAVSALFSLVCVARLDLPVADTVGQWGWFDKMAMCASGLILVACFFMSSGMHHELSGIVSWALMCYGGIEAVWGLCQLYGCVASRHSLYALTGSFFNPGPYSGYLAMILPICLHQWLAGGKVKRAIAGGVALLILCVLPAGMSRSAWAAAGASCLWVYSCHTNWRGYLHKMWLFHGRWMVMAATGCVCVLVLAGCLLFALKADSARGRLFMWKMACRAIAEKPLTGHGIDNVAVAYGDAQEAYFSSGDYEPWEEHVAGSPEYAFNEYLQAAVELGIPRALGLLAVVFVCLYIGVRKGRYGTCGAILSLMVFSFSSYPLQLPVFIVTLGGLLWTCVSGDSRWEWLGLAVLIGAIGCFRLKDDLRSEQACREWMNAKVLYNAGAYQSAEKDYECLYPLLKNRAAFLFEYGHGLHKQQKFEASNRILKEALKRSCDPMILNILGKNCQQTRDYPAAEDWFVRSTHRLPGRIYPYYLLAKLYTEPGFEQPDRFEEMKRIVLTKEPKVHSTAIRQMRKEVEKLSNTTPF